MVGFVLVVESNVINFIDGVDGLMGGLGVIIFFGLGVYLVFIFLELMIFCVCMSGSCLGFVVYNCNFVKVFMGDMGFLVLGGGLVVVVLLINILWVFFIVSGIFLIEIFFVIV